MATTTHLLYLHGFRSSPRSFKAQRVTAWLQQHRPEVHLWCPQLPPSPREAMAMVFGGIAGWPGGSSAVMGSSLGGFYAIAVAEATGWPAVLINPAVQPARDLAFHIGEQTAYHDPADRFYFRPEFIDELRTLEQRALTRRDRYLPVLATGDEVLDFAEMQRHCAGEPMRVVAGSDHALSDVDDHLPHVMRFLNLAP